MKLYIDYIWGRSKTQYQADVQAELDRIGQTRASRARDEGVEFVENVKQDVSSVHDPVESSNKPTIEYIALEELDMWFVTVTNVTWETGFKIEYDNWEFEEIFWVWNNYLWIVDLEKWLRSISYLNSVWKYQSIKPIQWIDSISINYYNDEQVCYFWENLDKPRFRPYFAQCLNRTTEAWSCLSNDYTEKDFACLMKVEGREYFDVVWFVENNFLSSIENIIIKWRENSWKEQYKILQKIETALNRLSWMEIYSAIVYMYDMIANWFNTPDKTDDFREKLISIGWEMEQFSEKDKEIALEYSDMNFFTSKALPAKFLLNQWVKYKYFFDHIKEHAPWDYKNLAISDWWYSGYEWIAIWWEVKGNDFSWNVAYGYSAAAWNIPLTIQRSASYSAQVFVDIKSYYNDDKLFQYEETVTIDNELVDWENIVKWYKLYKKFWLNIPVNYKDHLDRFDTNITTIQNVDWIDTIYLNTFSSYDL